MSSKVDRVVYAAVKFVDAMTPDERLNCSYSLPLEALVRAVEASGLQPGDEVFTLLRRDAAAPDTIRFWAMKAQGLSRGTSNAPKCDAARRLAETWQAWQLDNMTKVKVPD